MIKSSRLKKERNKINKAIQKLNTSTNIPVKMIYFLAVLVALFSAFVGWLIQNRLITLVLLVGTFLVIKELIRYNDKRALKVIESDLAYVATKISNHFEMSSDVLKAIDDMRDKTENEQLSTIMTTIVLEVNIVNFSLQQALDRQMFAIDSRLWTDFMKVLKSCAIDNEMRHALKSLAVEMDEVKNNQNLYDDHANLAWRELGMVSIFTIIIFMFLGMMLPEVSSHIFRTRIGTYLFSLYVASIFATTAYNLRLYKPLSEVGRRHSR